MAETTNPVTRLGNVVERLHKGEYQRPNSIVVIPYSVNGAMINQNRLGEAICDALDVEPADVKERYTMDQLVHGYGELLKMIDDAFYFTYKRSGERARSINLRYIRAVQEVLHRHSHLSSVQMFKDEYTVSNLDHLISVGDNLSPYDNEKLITQENIQEIVAMLDALTDKIVQSAIDPEVKDRMVQLLGNLRTQLVRVHVIGPAAIAERLDTFLGQTVKAVMTADTPEKRESARQLFNDGVETVGKVTQLIEYGGKIWPALEAVGVAFGMLPPSR